MLDRADARLGLRDRLSRFLVDPRFADASRREVIAALWYGWRVIKRTAGTHSTTWLLRQDEHWALFTLHRKAETRHPRAGWRRRPSPWTEIGFEARRRLIVEAISQTEAGGFETVFEALCARAAQQHREVATPASVQMHGDLQVLVDRMRKTPHGHDPHALQALAARVAAADGGASVA